MERDSSEGEEVKEMAPPLSSEEMSWKPQWMKEVSVLMTPPSSFENTIPSS
jgi:hypothetical protein